MKTLEWQLIHLLGNGKESTGRVGAWNFLARPWLTPNLPFSPIMKEKKIMVVTKCWQAYATPAIRKRFGNLCLQSLALTKVSFNEFPLRYDSMGGSWNISFRCGWFSIRCQFPMSIFLKLNKAGWYCVTKGNIFFFVLCLCFQGNFLYLWS